MHVGLSTHAHQLLSLAAAAGVALAVWAAGSHGPSFEVLFVLVALSAAYTFTAPRTVLAHVGVCTVAAALPILYRVDSVAQLTRMAVLLPAMWVAAAVVRQLRAGVLSRHAALADSWVIP